MKILGISGGMHSCGLAYLKDGKPEFAFEEERFNRVRTYKDFYKDLFRFPYECGQNVWYNKDFDWNELDYIGIDAYFPLTAKKTPTIEEFEAGWQPHKIEIQKTQKKFNTPVLFTEYGYRSIDFTGKKPWDSKRITGSINLLAQKNGLQAIHNQFWKEDWFAGGFIWKWFHKHIEVGGENNNRFTPQNKPAQDLLKKLYQ